MPVRPKRGPFTDLLNKLSLAFIVRKHNPTPRLHPDELSDHLKRDLGFLDGRG